MYAKHDVVLSFYKCVMVSQLETCTQLDCLEPQSLGRNPHGVVDSWETGW